MKRNASISTIFIFFVLISSLTLTLGVVNDKINLSNQAKNYKHKIEEVALSAAKLYSYNNKSFEESENISKKLFEKDLQNKINYDWDIDNNTLTVFIPDFKLDTFWLKILDQDTVNIGSLSATVKIKPQDIQETDNFIPIAINGCNIDYSENTINEADFILNTYDNYSEEDQFSFYPLTLMNEHFEFEFFQNKISEKFKNNKDNNSYFHKHKQFHFSHGSSCHVKDKMFDFSNYFNIDNFTQKEGDIVILDCGSTPDNPIVKRISHVEIEQPSCASTCCFQAGPFKMCNKFMCIMSNFASIINQDNIHEVSIHNRYIDTPNITWGFSSSNCKDSGLFKLRLRFRDKYEVKIEK